MKSYIVCSVRGGIVQKPAKGSMYASLGTLRSFLTNKAIRRYKNQHPYFEYIYITRSNWLNNFRIYEANLEQMSLVEIPIVVLERTDPTVAVLRDEIKLEHSYGHPDEAKTIVEADEDQWFALDIHGITVTNDLTD